MSKVSKKSTAITAITVPAAMVLINKNRASRSACNVVRAEVLAHAIEAKVPVEADVLVPTGKFNDARNPDLRYNLINAIVGSPTVGDALALSVFGKPGTKHDSNAYKIRMVDVVFCITNGFVDIK